MGKVIFGNHSSIRVPRQDRDSIRKFYCQVLGGEIMTADPERDFIRLGADFHIAFLYGDVSDVSEFLRSARSFWLEIKSDNVEEMVRRILAFGVRRLEAPDPHLYFQAPGGQCLRLVGIDEDLSFYDGVGEGRFQCSDWAAAPTIGPVPRDCTSTATSVASDGNEDTLTL